MGRAVGWVIIYMGKNRQIVDVSVMIVEMYMIAGGAMPDTR